MVEVIIGNAGKGKTWSRCTNSRLPFAFNVKLTGLKSSFGKNFQPAYRVHRQYINIAKYNPLKGSSYINLPPELQHAMKVGWL